MTLLALAGIALLASLGGSPPAHVDARAASVAACARTPAPALARRLPRGMRALPLDSIVTGAVADRLALPAAVAARVDAREIDRGGRRIAAVMVMPAGAERNSLRDEVVAQAGGIPEEVRLGATTGTLVRLRVQGRAVVGLVAFAGCRALFVGGGEEAVVRQIAGALVRSG